MHLTISSHLSFNDHGVVSFVLIWLTCYLGCVIFLMWTEKGCFKTLRLSQTHTTWLGSYTTVPVWVWLFCFLSMLSLSLSLSLQYLLFCSLFPVSTATHPPSLSDKHLCHTAIHTAIVSWGYGFLIVSWLSVRQLPVLFWLSEPLGLLVWCNTSYGS